MLSKEEDMKVLEINFRRHLSASKRLFQNRGDHWRLEKYVQCLREMLSVLESRSSFRADELSVLKEEIKFLSNLVDVSKQQNAGARLVECSQLSVPPCSSNAMDTPSDGLREGVSLRQVKQKVVSFYAADVRRQLLTDGTADDESSLRLRSGTAAESESDLDAVLQHHNELQQRQAEEFLQLTRSLKDNITVAGHIVREDNKTLERLQSLADRNRTNLERESQRLEKHAYGSCDCFIWLGLLLVCLTFVVMVLFMRLFPKKAS